MKWNRLVEGRTPAMHPCQPGIRVSLGHFAVLLLCLCLVAVGRAALVQEPKPNIVFFLVDDMGWQDTSVEFHTQRTGFNDFFRTPSMERMARNGVRFTQAYACAVCTPTRVSWLSGQNATRHHVTNWTLKGETGHESDQLLPPPWKKEGFQPGTAPTVVELLRDAGYHTIHVGKAHWGAVGTPGSDPLKLGFKVNVAGHAAGAPGSYDGLKRYGDGLTKREVWAVPGLEEYKGTDTHLTDALTREACKEVRKAVSELHRPFFLYLAHYAVHTPLELHRPYDEHYRDKPVARSEVLYASMVEGMDASLGQLLDELKTLGVAERTIVIFYTDNGGVSHGVRGQHILGNGKDTHNLPLREGKGSAYEGGVRVPAIVSWAEPKQGELMQQRLRIRSGARCARPVMVEDLFPTFLRWGGVAVPTGLSLDGEDLTDLLEDPARRVRRSPLFWHFPNVWITYPAGSMAGYQPHSSIRLGDWKAIYFYEGERWELYDLNSDLGETRNLVATESAQLQELSAKLHDRLVKMHSPWPVDRVTGRPRKMKLPRSE